MPVSIKQIKEKWGTLKLSAPAGAQAPEKPAIFKVDPSTLPSATDFLKGQKK